MIISHRHRFIFLKTHKTAGTSLEIALSKFCGPEDIITPLQPADEELRRALGFRGPQHHGERPLRLYSRKDWLRRLRSGRRPPDYFNHISAAQLRPRIDPAIWAGYSKFAVSRNPWDAMISRYYHSTRRHRTRPSMARWLARRQRLIAENWSIYAQDGAPVVDLVLRYERLSDELSGLSDRLALPEDLAGLMAPIRAKGSFRPKGRAAGPRDLLTDAVIEMIARGAAAEIAYFGYAPPPPAAPAT